MQRRTRHETKSAHSLAALLAAPPLPGVCIGLLSVVFTTAPAPLLAQPAQPRIAPVVIFVHGRGQPADSIAAVRERFTGAFKSAQLAAYGAQIVPDSDIGFVWYTDVFDPGAQVPDTAPQCQFATASSATTQARLDGLREALIKAAVAAGLDKLLLKHFMADTYDYLSSANSRCEANMRVSMRLGSAQFAGRSVVLVAHSMGGIVSYAALMENALTPDTASDFHIARFVTLATQIGVPQVLRGVDGAYIQPPVPEPRMIRSWTNFRNTDDLLAFPVRRSFMATDPARRPREIVIDQPGDRHAVTTYLSNRTVLQTILWAWCDSFRSVVSRPRQCDHILRGGDP